MWNYALITPVYNEAGFIKDMITSVLRDNIPPRKWVIVDDGSTDNTVVTILELNEPVIELVRLPRKNHRAAGGESIVAHALARLNLPDYDFLARFDADIVLSAGYVDGILSEFSKDPRLGIAGGELWANGKPERQPECHVRGALKMYRIKCFQDIGGLDSCIGWDTLDETRAWVHGWRTRSFPRYRALHRRPTGAGLSLLREGWQRGRADYMNWSDPFFVALKTTKMFCANPPKAMAFAAGFLIAHAARLERTRDAAVRLARRRYQRARILELDGQGRL